MWRDLCELLLQSLVSFVETKRRNWCKWFVGAQHIEYNSLGVFTGSFYLKCTGSLTTQLLNYSFDWVIRLLSCNLSQDDGRYKT